MCPAQNLTALQLHALRCQPISPSRLDTSKNSLPFACFWQWHRNIYMLRTLWVFSHHTTKPVERSQNSIDLYPTWYTKYERSAGMVGGGWRSSLAHSLHRQNSVISTRQSSMLPSEVVWMWRGGRNDARYNLPAAPLGCHTGFFSILLEPAGLKAGINNCFTSWEQNAGV